MGYDERKPVYEAFRNGDLDIMVTVMVLSEGADFPMCDCVVMARPTRSRVLYSQMVGRALRLFENKSDALVLDLTGTTRRMKLIHLSELVHGVGIEITEVDENGEEAICEDCGMVVSECQCEPEEKSIRIKRDGPVDMVTIDLLDGDDTLWLETPAGVPFISLSDGWMVFVWPKDEDREAGEWAVGSINTRQRTPEGTPVGGWTDTDLKGDPVHHPLGTAIRKAQEWVIDSGFQLPSKYATWRTKSQAPSELQVKLASRLHIDGADRMTKGRLSDEISIAFAASVLDAGLAGEEPTE
jgi:hypothetical protein